MFDFSKPAEGTIASMSAGATSSSTRIDDKNEKKDKKDKKDKSGGGGEKDKKHHHHHHHHDHHREGDDGDVAVAVDDDQGKRKNDLPQHPALKTPPSTSPRLGALSVGSATSSAGLLFGAGGSGGGGPPPLGAFGANTSFGFFMAGTPGGFQTAAPVVGSSTLFAVAPSSSSTTTSPNQQLQKTAATTANRDNNQSASASGLNDNNDSTFRNDSSVNAAFLGGGAPISTNSTRATPLSLAQQHQNQNQNQQQQQRQRGTSKSQKANDDDDSDIEELDIGEVQSKKQQKQQLQGQRPSLQQNPSSSSAVAAAATAALSSSSSKAAQLQQLSDQERVRLNQLAMQKQFQDFGLYGVKSTAANGGSGSQPQQDTCNSNTDNNRNTDEFDFTKQDVLEKMTHEDILEFLPRSLLACNLLRQKGGVFDSNVYFRMTSAQGNHFILSARKRSLKSTTNFVVTASESSTSKKSEQFLGKVRGNAAKTEYIVYDQGDRPENGYFDEVAGLQQQQQQQLGSNSSALGTGIDGFAPGRHLQQLREELAYILYTANVAGSSGPRKMFVILPKPDPHFGHPTRHYKPRNEHETMKATWKQDPTQFVTLENKEATWNEALRSYQLNFRGRVKCQSVKNFQLVESSNRNRVVLQVGRSGDDEFVVDYQAPLTAFLALSIALTAFDGNFARE